MDGGTVCIRTHNRQVPMGLVDKGKFRNLSLAHSIVMSPAGS